MSSTNDPSSWRRRVGTIPYRLKDGPVINATDDGTTATETYVIRASDVGPFYATSFPAPIFLIGRTVHTVRRHMPGAPFLVTKEIEFKPLSDDLPGDPLGADDDAPDETYQDLYEAIISYSTDSSTGDGVPPVYDEFFEHSFTAGAQFLTVPPHGLKTNGGDINGQSPPEDPSNEVDSPDWQRIEHNGETFCIDETGTATRDLDLCPEGEEADGDNLEVKTTRVPATWVIPTIEHTLRRKYVLAPNFAHLASLLGRVNVDAPQLLFSSPSETCLFSGMTGRQVYVWNGAQAAAQPWTLELKFTQVIKRDAGRIYGWNHVYSPSSGNWERLFRSNGRPLYYGFRVQDVLNAIF